MKTNWPTKKLGEICEIYQPQTITSSEILKEGPFNVFGANGVIGYYSKYNHEGAEVLVTCRGATCGTINMSEPKSWITGNAMVVHPKDGKVLSKVFLFYVLKRSNLLKTITGTGQPQITRNSLAPFQILLPPLNIQKQIVERLDKIAEAQKLNNDLIQKSAELFQSLLHKELNPAGKDWEIKKLGDVSELVTKGTTPTTYGHQFTSSGIPFLRAEDVNDDKVNHKSVRYHISKETNNFLKRSQTKPNDTLITIAGTIGRVGYVPADASVMNMNQAVAIVRLKKSINYLYVFFLLQGNEIQKKIFGAKVIGTITNLSLTNIRNFKLPIPTLETQKQIVAKLSAVQEYKGRLLEQKSKLKELFESVLHKSMKNE